jgi:hypothetical protein
MPFSEFYCDPVNGSNLNGGSDSGTPSMSDTAGTGSWVSTTNVYISVATTGAVAVGQFISIYQSGATQPAYVARITAVSGGSGSAWTITLSSTAFSGSKPTTGSSFSAKVGGAWLGPTGTVGFPIGFISSALTDSGGDVPRVSFKNSATFSITAAMTQSTAGPIVFQGMTSTSGDGGYATISGPTTGTSFVLLTANVQALTFTNLILENNGNSGSSDGVVCNNMATLFFQCVVNSVRGNGFHCSWCEQCEVYSVNQSATSNNAGFNTDTTGGLFKRCISHSPTGTNTHGFACSTGGSQAIADCIADSNTGCGYYLNSSFGAMKLAGCVAYNSTSDGIKIAQQAAVTIDSCILVSNGGDGINGNSQTPIGVVNNCAFYSNANQTATLAAVVVNGSITLTGNPFTAPTTGNFTLNSTAGAGAACKAAGVGTFTQTASGYTGTVSSPDVGAVQATDTGGSGGGGGSILSSSIIQSFGAR